MLTNKICARHITSLIYFHIYLSTSICRPWTSPGNIVFTQIVSSYNYERLIRSISTPNKYALFLLIFLLLFVRPSFFTPFLPIPSIRTPPFYPSLLIRSIRTYIRTPLLLLPLFLPLLLSPLYVHIICTPFSQKIFPKKISTPKAYPKNFPKIFTYYNYSSPLLFNRKVNPSYSFYKILNTKFWRLYETIKTNEKNYYGFG